MSIQYRTGDATAPTGEGPKIIAHICNDRGTWGKGFVLALSRRWKAPAAAFKKWFSEKNDFGLGAVQFIQVEDDLWIANMVAQHGLRAKNGIPPVRYDALRTSLAQVAEKADRLNASVHMPRIRCGLAGGDWTLIEPVITDALSDRGIHVVVYDLA